MIEGSMWFGDEIQGLREHAELLVWQWFALWEATTTSGGWKRPGRVMWWWDSQRPRRRRDQWEETVTIADATAVRAVGGDSD
ncbi:hypothetical protein Syun_011506 [Stephania yunnanensis]|uniref:Uncharacterized protein n=1 Tax=Stephania yunnanensis TaxID=152371 RepID=A0AAP0PIK0_9MAGN